MVMIGQEANHPICEADAASRPRRRFVRYADDCNIYVRSRRAGERIMASVTCFLNRHLKLKVNTAKSAATPWQRAAMGTPGMDRPSRRKFLGFSFTAGKAPRPSGAVGTPRPHGDGASRRRRWPGSRRGSGS